MNRVGDSERRLEVGTARTGLHTLTSLGSSAVRRKNSGPELQKIPKRYSQKKKVDGSRSEITPAIYATLTQNAYSSGLLKFEEAQEHQECRCPLVQAPRCGRGRWLRRDIVKGSRAGESNCGVAQTLQQYCNFDIDAERGTISEKARASSGSLALQSIQPIDGSGQPFREQSRC